MLTTTPAGASAVTEECGHAYVRRRLAANKSTLCSGLRAGPRTRRAVKGSSPATTHVGGDRAEAEPLGVTDQGMQRYVDSTLGDSSENFCYEVDAEKAFAGQPLGLRETAGVPATDAIRQPGHCACRVDERALTLCWAPRRLRRRAAGSASGVPSRAGGSGGLTAASREQSTAPLPHRESCNVATLSGTCPPVPRPHRRR
jgi:hypothetical protein